MRMNKIIGGLFFISQIAEGAGITVQGLPSEPEQPNPVCRDVNGKLSNCTPTAGVSKKHLVPDVVDSNGLVIGKLVGTNFSSYFPYEYKSITVFSSTRYLYKVNQFSGDLNAYMSDVYFENLDCTGRIYVRFPPQWVAKGEWEGSIKLYYTPNPNSAPSSVPVQSRYHYDYNSGVFVCVNNAVNAGSLSEALPNNPDVTGVSSTYPYFNAPITIVQP